MVDCCCCCIPVRLGTIILAILTLILSVFGAIGYLGKPDELLVGFPRGVSTLFGLLFIVMGLISVFGIIGSFFSSPGAVKLFEWMLWGIVLSFVIISVVTVVNSINNKQLAIDKCVSDLQNETDKTLGGVNESNADKVVVSDITNATTGALNDKISGNFPDVCKERERVKIWLKIIGALLLTLFGAYFAGVTSRFADDIKPTGYKRSIPTKVLPDSKSIPTSKV